jgi:hypothetical protein
MRSERSSWFVRCSCAVMAAALALAPIGCKQVVRFTSDPDGASVWVNDKYIGETPTNFFTRSGTPDTLYVKVEKGGYVTIKSATIDKSYHADVYLFLLLPGIIPYFLIGAQMEDSYDWKLQKIGGPNTSSTDVPPPAPVPAIPAPADPVPAPVPPPANQ